MNTLFVDTQQALHSIVDHACQQQRVAIDLEGDGLFRYRSRLCTMQLRTADTSAVIDTLALPDLHPLEPLLSANGPEKVIHDVSFDARLLHAHGLPLGNVFDTALAARYLGEPGTGLQALLRKHCGVELDKELQQHDWGARPLQAHMLHYLHQDVRYLFELHDHLRQAAQDMGILPEISTELAYMLSQVTAVTGPPKPAWRRVKKSALLSPTAQSVLRELCALRESLAQAADVPPFRILHDRSLLQLAQDMPTDAGRMRRGRDRVPSSAHSLIPQLLQAIERGRQPDSPPPEELEAPEEPPTAAVRARRKELEKALSGWRRREAESRGVDVQVVLPGHALADLANRRPANLTSLRSIDGIGEARFDRYAEHWLTLVNGTPSD